MIAQIQVQKASRSRVQDFDFDNVTFGKVFTDHMFLADYDGQEWGNLRIVPYGDVGMSPAMSVIHYGQGIFEGMKAYKNEAGAPLLFRPGKNLDRMNYSAGRMCMPEIPEDIFMEGLHALLKIDSNWIPTKAGSALYIRPCMYAADTFIGVRPSETFTFAVFCCPVNAYYNAPLKVLVADEYVRAVKGGVGDAKCAGNYAAAMLATKEAAQKGYSQILWTDAIEHKYLEETGTTNVFVKINDTVITPELDGTILDGVTRDSAIALMKQWGIKVEERKISIDEVIAAYNSGTLKEMFATGTAATVVAIDRIGYKGENYDLGNPENWETMNKIKATLEGIKSGKMKDEFGWIVEVK